MLGRAARCSCGNTRLISESGEGVCFDCLNAAIAEKNQLVKDVAALEREMELWVHRVRELQEELKRLRSSQPL
jgi:hypothetical protein